MYFAIISLRISVFQGIQRSCNAQSTWDLDDHTAMYSTEDNTSPQRLWETGKFEPDYGYGSCMSFLLVVRFASWKGCICVTTRNYPLNLKVVILLLK